MKVKKTYVSIILVLVCALLILRVEPLIFSEVTGTPLWYLQPQLVPLSIVTTTKDMRVEVTPSTPTILGEIVRVTVFDSDTGAPVGEATVEVKKDGAFILSKTTGDNGTAEFEYPGEATIITVKKEGYNKDVKVIPKIPDEWVRTLTYQRITWGITLLCTLGPAALLYYKSRQKKRKKR